MGLVRAPLLRIQRFGLPLAVFQGMFLLIDLNYC
jgi:hypothetical protein